MDFLKFSVVAPQSAKKTRVIDQMGAILRAACVGRGPMPVRVMETLEHEIQFVVDGQPTGTAKCVIDLTKTGLEADLDLDSSPELLDAMIAGFPPPIWIKDKLKNLDSPDLTWCVVSDEKVDVPNWLTEEQVFDNPDRLRRVSHALLVGSGRRMLCERLVMSRGVAVFVQDCGKNVDASLVVPVTNLEDFLAKCEAMAAQSGGTSAAFMKNVVPRVFSEDAVSARSCRATLGSILRKKLGSHAGLLDLHVAQERLVARARRKPDTLTEAKTADEEKA